MKMNKINLLKELLIFKKNKLKWGFLLNNSSYDWDICDILGMQEDTVRYWDAKWNWLYLEFKKWKSIWLDLVRYSEILIWINDLANNKTFTLFFIPDSEKKYINEIIWVSTDKLIIKLELNINKAKVLIELKSNLPRSLNAQASLTVNDIREISDFIV